MLDSHLSPFQINQSRCDLFKSETSCSDISTVTWVVDTSGEVSCVAGP